MLLLCDRHNSHLTYSTVKKSQANHNFTLLTFKHKSRVTNSDVGFFAPLKCHWKKMLKNWLRESRHKNVEKSIFPTLLNALVSKIDSNFLKSGFNGSGLYPVKKSKPMKKIINMQPKCDEVDKSNEK